MTATIKYLKKSWLVWSLAALYSVLIIAAQIFNELTLQDIINAMSLAAWTGALVAYSRHAIVGLREMNPTKPMVLAVGICLSGFAAVLGSLAQLYALNFDGQWIYGTDLVSWVRWTQMCAAICHMAAPQAIEGKIPTKAMVKIGVITAAGVLMLLALWGLKIKA